MSEPPAAIPSGTPFDLEQTDRLLTTTRAVRRKLDLDRPVPDEVILKMIDIAEQAPSGANQASRRWLVVRDAGQKRRIAEIYREVAGPALTGIGSAMSDSDPSGGRLMDSTRYLAEHLEQVPALVLATIYGVHDGGGTPGLFDSVVQAAWSFCLAGRARGIGTAWTTMHLTRADDVAAVLGIPAGVTQIVLFPVAYTTTSDFGIAPRPPAHEITYVDHWGFTPNARPPGDRAHYGHGRGVRVDQDVAAPPERVWPLVTDITLPGRFSHEAVTADWRDPATPPGVGSVFTGTNSCETTGHPEIDDVVTAYFPDRTWRTTCTVTAWQPRREFAYAVADMAGEPAATWAFTLRALVGGGTRVTHSVVLDAGMSGTSAAAAQTAGDPEEIVTARLLSVRADITRTLHGVRRLAEA